MTLGGFLLLLVTASCMAVANFLMKSGIGKAGGFELSLPDLFRLARQPRFVAGFLLSGIAAVIWFRILATQKLSTCYPLFVGLTYSLITAGAFYFFQEKISVQKLAGLGAIVAGIAAIARS